MGVKFSIIIPTYCAGNKIIKTIDSICSQTYYNYEIFIEDGMSKDNTIDIIKQLQSRNNKIKLNRKKDNGIYDAMNQAVKEVTGDYCIFLGAGDELYNKKVLEHLDSYLEKNKKDILYGYVVEIERGIETLVIRKLNWKYKVKFTPVCHQAVCAKTQLLREYPFDVQYKIAADQDWLLKMKKKRKKFGFINRAISYYPRDGLSSSADGEKLFVKEQKKIHSTYYPFWMHIRYTWRKVIGKDKWKK